MAIIDGQTVSDTPVPGTAYPTTIIQPTRGWVSLRLRELWDYRELLVFLLWRDLKVRYRQTAIGALWVVIQPVVTMVVFSIFFGGLVKVPSDGLPYPIFTFTALLPWTLFATSLTRATGSMLNNAQLISKVYFPRLIAPIASTLAGVVDFAIALVVLVAMMIFFQIMPTPLVFLLPLFVLLALMTSLAAGLWLSALYVQYRDVAYVLPFLIQIWLYATPVVYPSSLLGEPWRTIYALNPMVGVVEGFRWVLLGTNPPGPMIAVSSLIALLLFVSGAFYFRRVEKTFADVI